MADLLEIAALEKVYPDGSRALKGVGFSVEPGTFMVLLGPSGSGKTTLMRTVAGIERATAGTIAIGGKLVAGPGHHVPPERRDLSMVFQDYALWPHLVVRDNVAFALRRHRLSKEETRRRALDMVERVGLGHLARRYPGELSGGEQQRVALARALVGDAGLLLCDEPLSNLDADLRDRMRVQISSLVREAGATTIYITHDQQEAFALADRIGVLELGNLVQIGTPETVYAFPSSAFVARFTGLAGELAVRVETRAGAGTPGGLFRVAPEEFPTPLPLAARSEAPLRPGERALLAVRPSAVRACAPADEDCQLLGRVADVAFRGRHYELAVDVAHGPRLSGIHAERRPARGEPIGLVLDAEGCHLFAHPGDTPPAAGDEDGAASGGAAGGDATPQLTGSATR